jgi:hypothetical protein
VSGRPVKTLAQRISGLGELSQFATELQEPMDSVLDVFPEQPRQGLHIIVHRESYVDLYVIKCPANVVLLSTSPTTSNARQQYHVCLDRYVGALHVLTIMQPPKGQRRGRSSHQKTALKHFPWLTRRSQVRPQRVVSARTVQVNC